jgi:hypothetical protein
VALKYKRLILLGKLRLPLDVARPIVGPDCAYHLYFTRHQGTARGRRRSRRRG